MTKNIIKPLIVGVILGSAISLITYTTFFQTSGDAGKQNAVTGKKKILYWVAPMNPNYRRDKPGKSPMGADLVPVYDNSDAEGGPGTITISPNIVNNLGVRTTLAERKALHSIIKTVGYVQYDQDKMVHVHPRVSGWVEKLYVKAAGDPVKKGQPLYDIYSPELVNAQEEWVLAYNRNNKRLIKAAEMRLIALQLPKSAIRKLKKSRQVMQTITMYAPQSGVLDNLKIREGGYIKPGTTMMSIGVLDQVWVEADIFERQAGQVAVGQPVTMSLDFLPGKDWPGMVDYIYPSLNVKTRTLRVRLRFENNNEELKPNMFAQIIIHLQGSGSTLLVPTEAVVRTGNLDRVVLALGGGRFKSIKVKIGRVDDKNTEILSGLEEGDRIVTSAQFLLDSESSKTSDFRRMNHQMDHEGMEDTRPLEMKMDMKMKMKMKPDSMNSAKPQNKDNQ